MPSFMNRSCRAPDAGFRLASPAHDLVGANTVGAREDDRRTPSVFLRGITVPGDRFKSAADGPRDRDGNSGAHAQTRTATESKGSRSGFLCQAAPLGSLCADPHTNFDAAISDILLILAAVLTTIETTVPSP